MDKLTKFQCERKAEKEIVLPALLFSRKEELGYLAAVKRDEGSTCVMPRTLTRKLA